MVPIIGQERMQANRTISRAHQGSSAADGALAAAFSAFFRICKTIARLFPFCQGGRSGLPARKPAARKDYGIATEFATPGTFKTATTPASTSPFMRRRFASSRPVSAIVTNS